MRRTAQSHIAGTRWSIRLIPVFIICGVAFATYAVVAHFCVDYLYKHKGQNGVAATLLVLYFLFFILTIASYLRTFVAAMWDPALVPLSRQQNETTEKPRRRAHRRGRDVESDPYVAPDMNPDSPGLERFYSKNVFVCEVDGRPKWCSPCMQWKPDRTNHSSELERCVRKMDHLCPWVGGMVSETSFNFFLQFTSYCTAYLAVCLATGAYCLHLQMQEGNSLDGRAVALVALSGFFILFTSGMSLTSARFMIKNCTNIDMLRRSYTHYLAVRVPRNTPPSSDYQTITYPLSSGPPQPNGQPTPGQAPGIREPTSTRDQQATRTFAILQTEPNENPFDLGYWRNFKSVMGNNIVEWLLPIKHSPCCNHDSMESDYEFGPVLQNLKKRYGVPDIDSKTENGIEMHDVGASRR